MSITCIHCLYIIVTMVLTHYYLVLTQVLFLFVELYDYVYMYTYHLIIILFMFAMYMYITNCFHYMYTENS